MNEEALKYSFDLFVKDGYNGTIDDYKELIKTNDKARSVSYNLFTSDGYNGSDADFNNLMGIDNTIMLSDEELGKTNDSASVDPNVESNITGSESEDGLLELPGNNRGKRNKAQKELKDGKGFWSLPFDDNPNNSWTDDFSEAFKGAVKYLAKEYPSATAVTSASPAPILPGGRNVVNGILEWVAKDDAEDLAEIENDPEQFYVKYGYSKDLPIEEQINQYYFNQDLNLDDTKSNLGYNPEEKTDFVDQYYLNDPETKKLFKEANIEASDFQAYLQREGKIKNFNFELENGGYDDISYGDKQIKRSLNPNSKYSKVEATIEGPLEKEQALQDFLSDYLMETASRNLERVRLEEIKKNSKDYEGLSLAEAQVKAEAKIMEDPDAYGYGTHIDFNKAYDWNQNNWEAIQKFKKLQIQEAKKAQEEIKEQKKSSNTIVPIGLEEEARAANQSGAGFIENVLPGMNSALEWVISSASDGRISDPFFDIGFTYSEKKVIQDAKRIRRENNLDKLDPANLKYLYAEGQQVELNGIAYIKSKNGTIKDVTNGFDVSLTLTEAERKAIDKKIENGDSVYSSDFDSFGGSYLGGKVVGELITQIFGQKGLGTVRKLSSLAYLRKFKGLSRARLARMEKGLNKSNNRRGVNYKGVTGGTKGTWDTFGKKIPLGISKEMADAIIFQSGYGSMLGYTQAKKAALAEGMSIAEAEAMAHQTSLGMGILFALTTPINPRTGMYNKIFSKAESKLAITQLIKASANAAQVKKLFPSIVAKAFNNKVTRAGAILTGEGVKELVQENVQQVGENLLVNRMVNESTGKRILKDTYSYEDFVNTSILSFAAGGLSGGAGKLMSKLSPSAKQLDDRQKVAELKKLSQNVKVSTTLIENYGRQGLLTDKEVKDIISELNKFANNVTKMPSFLGDRRVSSELLKVIDIQDRINKLEKAKKNSIPGEQNIIEEDLKALKTEQETVLRETKEKLAESNKAFDEKFSTNLNGIVKFINKIARVAGRQIEMSVFESTEDFINGLKQQGFSDTQIQKAVDSDGAFIGDGKIFINKEVARQTGAWTVASHEIIHPILNKLIGNALQQGVRVDELKKILPRKVVRTIEKKIAKTQEGKSNTEFITYLSDALIKEEINLEPSILDKLRVFFNKLLGRAGASPQLGFANGREVYNWLKEFSTSLRETGEVSQTAADAIISTGVDLSDAQTVGGKMDLSVNQEILDLTDALDAAEDAYAADPNNPTLEKNVELAEKALDEAEERAISGAPKPKVVTPKPKKEKKKPAKKEPKPVRTTNLAPQTAQDKKIMNTYNEGMKDTKRTSFTSSNPLPAKVENKLIPLFEGYINTLVQQKFKQYQSEALEFQDALAILRVEAVNALRTFNPARNQNLSGYVRRLIALRQPKMFEKANKEFTSSLEDVDVAGDAGVIRNFADEKQIAPENLIKASKVISTKVRAKLASDLKTWTEANGINFDFFNFGDVDPNITIQVDGKDVKILNEVLKELFPGVDPEKFLDSRTMFTSGEAGIVLGKLAENDQELVELFINLLPRGAVMPKGKNKAIVKDANYGKSTRLDGSILKNFYNKGTERFTKKAGLTPFALKDNIRYSDVHQAFGMDSSGNKLNYNRAKSGIVLASAYKMLGKLILNEVIRTDLGLTAEQQMNVGAGKGDLQFSKSDALYFDDESLIMFSKLTNDVKDLLLDFKGRVYTDRFTGKLGGKSRSKINEEYKKLAKKFKNNKNATLLLEEIKEYKELLQGMSPNEQEENIIKVFIQEAKTNKDLNSIQVERNRNNNSLDFKFEYFGKEYIIEVKKNVKARLSGLYLNLVESGKDKDGKIKYALAIDSKYINSGVFTEAQLNKIKDFEENKIVLLEGIQDAIAEEKYGLTTEDLIIEKSKGKRVRILISDKLKALIFETKELEYLLYIKRVKKILFPISVIDRLYAFKGADIINFSDVGAYFVGDASKNKFSGILPKLSEATTKNGEEAQVKMRPFFRYREGSKPAVANTKTKYSTLYQTASFEMNLAADQAALSGESTYNFQDPKQAKEGLEILKAVLQPSKSIESINVYNNANKINAKPKGISVWDFDDTLAKTKSNVLYTMPDGTKGKLNAEEFAKKGDQMLEEGVEFDFSEFSKVVNGSKGPFFEKAMARNKKFGNKNVFILTARPANSANAIHEFLKGIGLNIPLENITGLANSSPQAKADWVVGKAAEGYNDFYFADDAIQNVKAVAKALEVLDVKSKVRQANVQFSKSMNSEFNQMIEKKSGIDARGTISKYKASVMGRKKGRFQFFIPPGAEDFEGLMYKLLDKGKLGEQQKEWFKKALFDPFARGINEFDTYKLQVANAVRQLKKSLKDIPKELGKRDPKTDFKYEDAVRVYLWQLNGHEIKGISESDIKALVDIVKNSPNLKRFARQLNKTMGGYPAPQESWLAGTITTDAINMVNTIKRKEFLETWQQNADIIFSEDNLNKLEATFGEDYVEALKDSLYRMKSGRNRPSGANKLTNRFMNWVNDSVATIMFFNTRSALLQTLSTVNFINWGDNNPLLAAKAFSNQKQFWGDFAMLFNSDFLKSRRTGLKNDVNADEIANAAATQTNKAKAALAILLKAGFLPTQIADSFAIAMGGASFYRNRVNTYMQKGEGKPGMGRLAAEEQAFLDFQEIAEATQQSSRPDRVSQQQASPLGRIILAFANTPMQYMRLTKKAFLDLKNGRGSAKENITKMLYYAAIQNVIFSSLQAALFATLFDDEEEEETKKKGTRVANTMLDSMLRGLGIYGAVASTVKNIVLEIDKQSKKDRPDYSEAAVKALDLSPPISSKIRKGRSAGRAFSYKKTREKMVGFGLDNPAYYAVGQIASATANIPLDRAIGKANHVRLAFAQETKFWQSVSLLLGFSEWDLNMIEKDKKKNKFGEKMKWKKRKLKKRKLK